MALLSWGKPTIYVKDLDESGAKFRALPTPVEDSTSLETSAGDKTEAKIEGGTNEDVRYNKSTFALNFDIRMLKGRAKPFDDKDGLVLHNYEIYLVPEDPTCYGLHIAKAHVNVTTNYSADNGITQTITCDALEADGVTEQLEIGVVTASGDTISITPITATAEK